MRFDDLAKERITLVDIEKAMKTESPYLLFYQIVPIEGDPGHITDGERPPSYAESLGKESSFTGPSTTSLPNEGPPGDRRPSLGITEFEEPRGRSSFTADRRPSMAFTDSSLQSVEGGLRPDSASNVPAMAHTKTGSLSLNPSRRSSFIRKSRSNPGSRSQSQSGEARTGSAISKMAPRLSREKLDRIESGNTGDRGDTIAITAVEKPEPAATTFENSTLAPAVTPTPRLSDKATGKDAKREKSRNRLSRHQYHQSHGKVKERESKPDRECVVM
jgi:hypothetical protein